MRGWAWGVLAMIGSTASGAEQSLVEQARAVVAHHEQVIRPLEIEVGKRWWLANTSGRDEDFKAKQEVETQLDLALARKEPFERLKAAREALLLMADGDAELAQLKRQLELLYRQYLAKQLDPALLSAMLEKSNSIEQAFNVFRPKIGDREYTDNEMRTILKQSRSSEERQRAWEASKQVGQRVEADLKELVRLRNEAARALGFQDYHVMQLYLAEQEQDKVLALFDELDALTREPFAAAKREIDAVLAAHCGVSVEELRPWHYHDPFFQESPAVFGGDLDGVYASADLVKLAREFYQGIGLPVADVLERSDLYEKPGKSPHAFCTDIDREGDVRVLCNVVPNEYWMGTLLHELGHAVYSSKNIPRTLPYVLRGEAHILSTEGVAMMFERFSKSAAWLKSMGVSVADPAAFDQAGSRMRRNRLLIFSRWCQVMLRFEKALYADPSQDLNRLWWELVERYQLVPRPMDRNMPDYASKIHIVSAPAYYHNYMLGELFACQVHATICREVLGGVAVDAANYAGQPRVGQFMMERVFAPGRTWAWDELTRRATGEPLNAKAFAAEFRGN